MVLIKVSSKEDRLSSFTTAKKCKHTFLHRQQGTMWWDSSCYRWAQIWPTVPYPLLREDSPLAEADMLVHTLYPGVCLPGSVWNTAPAQAPCFHPSLSAVQHRGGHRVLLHSVVSWRWAPGSCAHERVQLHFRDIAWVNPFASLTCQTTLETRNDIVNRPKSYACLLLGHLSLLTHTWSLYHITFWTFKNIININHMRN